MAILFLAYLFLASAITANKMILQTLSPLLLVGIRMVCAGLFLVIYNYRRSTRFHLNYLKEDWYDLLIITLFTTFIPSLLKAFALKYMVSSKTALLGSIDPFITALYVYVLWHEKITLNKLIGMLIGFAGVTVSLLSTSPLEETLHAWSIFSYPELAMLASVALGRYGWLRIQALLKRHRYQPSEVNGIAMLGSGFCASMVGLLNEQHLSFALPSWKVLGLIAYTVVVGNIFGYTLYAHALKRYPATLVSLCGFSIPLLVSFFGWLLLGEQLTWYFVVAAVLIFTGFVVFYRKG